MKILFAVHHFPPKFTGGAEWRAFRTAKMLQERGNQVSVVCVEDISSISAAPFTWENEVFQGIPVQRLYFDMSRAEDSFVWQYNNPWIKEHFTNLLREQKPDLLHLFSGYLMGVGVLQAARQNAVPTVLSPTDFWFLCPRYSMFRTNDELCELPIDPARCVRCLAEESRRYRLPAKLFPGVMQTYWSRQTQKVEEIEKRKQLLLDEFSKIDAVISPSRFLKEFHIKAGARNENFIFSRQGNECADIPEAETSKIASDVLRIGYIGQVAWKKGIHVMLKALRQIPDADLILKLYGNLQAFPDYVEEQKLFSKSDTRVHWKGIFPREDLGKVFREIDLLIVPSIWYENSPNAILESLAYKTALLVSNLGGMAEMVKDDLTGLHFEVGSDYDLAQKIQMILDQPELLKKFQQGIQPVKSIPQEIDELEAIYSQTQKAFLNTGE